MCKVHLVITLAIYKTSSPKARKSSNLGACMDRNSLARRNRNSKFPAVDVDAIFLKFTISIIGGRGRETRKRTYVVLVHPLPLLDPLTTSQ